MRTKNHQTPSGRPTRVGGRKVAAAAWPMGHPAPACFNTVQTPQHRPYNNDGQGNYKHHKQMPHYEGATSSRYRTTLNFTAVAPP